MNQRPRTMTRKNLLLLCFQLRDEEDVIGFLDRPISNATKRIYTLGADRLRDANVTDTLLYLESLGIPSLPRPTLNTVNN